MISGIVVAGRGPIIPLVLHDASGNAHSTKAAVDTGFTGWLTLPASIIVALGMTSRGRVDGILADGSTIAIDSFEATVIWDGQPRAVLVHEVESEPLVGIELLEGFRFTMDTVDGGLVQIERL